jgi:nicotinamide mononucleotide transporter
MPVRTRALKRGKITAMTNGWELAANLLNATSILLATLNSRHTWWTGIVGCSLFGWVFLETQLYADATLQIFFIVTSAIGWWNWSKGNSGAELPVRHTPASMIVAYLAVGAAVAGGYGWLLHVHTNAYAPFADATVLVLSVLGQLLLMSRRYESWWCWLAANSIAVPLFLTRGLDLTALLYTAFWINAIVALFRWRRLVVSRA